MKYMKLRSFVLLVALVISTLVVFADNNYKVISSSRLNVRKTPSIKGLVLGRFESGQEIEVVLIDKGWAKVKFKDGFGYVSDKYIAPLLTKEKTETKVNNTVQPNKKPYSFERVDNSYTKKDSPENIFTLLENVDIYLSAQAGAGYSNFIWNNGKVNGALSYSLDIVAQLYFTKTVGSIPENWYSEVALGYERKGAAKFGMDYIRTQICPLGYKIDVTPFNVIVKGGLSMGYPLNDFNDRWKANFQVGAVCGTQIDWEQFSVGLNLSYDFTEVSSDCGQKLNNIAVIGTIAYKFKNIKGF